MLLQQNLELLYCIYYQRKHIIGSLDLEAGEAVGTMPLFRRISERMENTTSKPRHPHSLALHFYKWGCFWKCHRLEGNAGKTMWRWQWENTKVISGTPPPFGPILIRAPDSASLRLIASDPGLVGACFTFIGIVALYLPHRWGCLQERKNIEELNLKYELAFQAKGTAVSPVP